LPHEFVFSSGRRCRTFDELVEGCQYEWEDARTMLHSGVFSQYLASIGRMDLTRTAREAQANPDPDIGLHTFVSALPVTGAQGPRLELNPRRLIVGPIATGATHLVQLTVANSGKGLLQGKLTVNEGSEWLRLGDGDGTSTLPLKTAREHHVKLRIVTRGLAPRIYSARLTVITNGGVVEIPVRLEVTAHPFSCPPFQGAASPRELAERMKNQPKHGVPLLESGEVARWFALNGWTYPVQGAPARGVAAVQQFFEGMGLARPPVLQLAAESVRLTCAASAVVPGQVALKTSNRKWVYATVASDLPWLRVVTPAVSGPQEALVSFQVDARDLEAGRVHEGFLRVTANAGKQLTLRVVVDVRYPHQPLGRRLLRSFLAGAALGLLYRVCLVLPADLVGRVLTAPAKPLHARGDFATWLHLPGPDGVFVWAFVLATWWLGGVGGGVWLWRRGGRMPDILCGAVAGSVAGLIGAATLACVVPLLDVLPLGLWRLLDSLLPPGAWPGRARGWLWTPAWILLACACWSGLGGVLGLGLSLLGQRGRRLLQWLAAPWGRLCRLLRLKRAANLFTP
jgi:hypothetical protein